MLLHMDLHNFRIYEMVLHVWMIKTNNNIWASVVANILCSTQLPLATSLLACLCLLSVSRKKSQEHCVDVWFICLGAIASPDSL